MDTAEKIGLLPGFGWIADHSFLWTLLICWALTPGMMFVIGLVGESRLIPWTPSYQFLSFLPGDFFLGGMAAGLLVLSRQLPAERHLYNNGWFHLVLLLGAAAVAVIITRGEYNDPNGYGHRAVLSPTKLYHNLLLYGGYGYIIVATLVALVAWAVMQHEMAFTGLLVLCLLPGLIWVGLLVVEQKVPENVKRDRVHNAHVNDWSPIWQLP